jgi:hypothetical protein
MFEDPVVDEIRKFWQEHAAKYGNDLKQIVKALQEKQEQSNRPVIKREPKRIPVDTKS